MIGDVSQIEMLKAMSVRFAVCVLSAAALSLGLGVRDARADIPFGDWFGIAPINQTPYQFPPAFPEGDHAFWFGACDRGAAPAAGSPIVGGIGTRPATLFVPAELGTYQFNVVPAPAIADHCVDRGVEAVYPCSAGEAVFPCPVTNLWVGGSGRPSWRFAPVLQAGAHPDVTTTFYLARNQDPDPQTAFAGWVDGAADNVVAELPAGFSGDPRAVTQCGAAQFAVKPLECPSSSQVGVLLLRLEASALPGNLGRSQLALHPLYNLEPRHGNVAEFGVAYLADQRVTTSRLVAKVRTNGDFGVTTLTGQLPAVLPVISAQVTVWGVPWSSANDEWRAEPATQRIPFQGLVPADRVPYDSSWGPIRPFLSNPTECTGAPRTTRLLLDSYENPAALDADGFPVDHPNWAQATSDAPPLTGCEKPPFDPGLTLEGTNQEADGPSGLSATVALPANDDPPAPVATDPSNASGAPAHWRSDAGIASAQLQAAQVTLPVGWSVNPAGAAGLEGCSDEEFGLVADGDPPRFDNDDPFDGAGHDCPLGSRVGTVTIETPVLDEPLGGDLVLANPRSTDPTSGDMFRLFIVARSPRHGLVAKAAGSAVADPVTGQLTTTFTQNPRVPFESIQLQVKGGQRAMLATPADCGTPGWSGVFSPWTEAHGAGGVADQLAGALTTDERCANGFSPDLSAASSSRKAAGHTTFSLRFTREDGDQWLTGARIKLPQGLLAAVGDVPLCTNAQADANACPAASRIGTVDAGAGAGDPFFLERKGAVYLTEGYKGAPFGTAVSVPVEAGPFTGAFALDPIVVRQALHVDPTTAQATAISDPLPHIHHGIPLRARVVKVSLDRPDFVVNPTDCSPKQIEATFTSIENATATATTPYQARDCHSLPFKPQLRLTLKGRKQTTTGDHPAIRARVTQPAGAQAAIKHAKVTLPRSLALDPDNAQGLCEFADGTQPDPENHCPPASIVGHAKATSPLLAEPLQGPVFFVKNIRIDPRTGNEIRTLPMIVTALRGEIAVNLRGKSSTTRNGRLQSTFSDVPDAPVHGFTLNIRGGKHGILVITRTARHTIDICRKPQTAATRLTAHNNKLHNANTRLHTPACDKPKKKKRKR